MCIANAVADALGTGEPLALPLLPARLAPHVEAALARRRGDAQPGAQLGAQHGGRDEAGRGTAPESGRRDGARRQPGPGGAG